MIARGPKKKYALDGFDGLVSKARARSTGLEVGVYASDQAGMEMDPELPWATVCEAHGSVVCHPTLELARAHAAQPDWCEQCQALVDVVPDFKDRYMITKTNAEIYGYEEMRAAATRLARSRAYVGADGKKIDVPDLEIRQRVVDALHDDAFMRFHRGEIPARVAEAIADRVWSEVYEDRRSRVLEEAGL